MKRRIGELEKQVSQMDDLQQKINLLVQEIQKLNDIINDKNKECADLQHNLRQLENV